MQRYERKYNVDFVNSQEIERILMNHPALFREIYFERKVNNVYFDTISFKIFYDNINGSMHRKKYRIRWYGNPFGKVENPKLEVKNKSGFLGWKNIYKLKSFIFKDGFSCDFFSKLIANSNIPEEITKMLDYQKPVAFNSYDRKYFLSIDKKYRVTIDKNQCYSGVTGYSSLSKHYNVSLTNNLIELKYRKEFQANINHITNYLPFRITKNSKYVNAIIDLYC